MGWFETLTAVILGGIGLGGAVGGLFSYRRGAEVKLKDSIISDSDKRIKQLEEETLRIEKERDEAQIRIQQLETERQLPLTELTTLIVRNHTDQTKQNQELSRSMNGAVKAMNQAVKALTKGGKQ